MPFLKLETDSVGARMIKRKMGYTYISETAVSDTMTKQLGQKWREHVQVLSDNENYKRLGECKGKAGINTDTFHTNKMLVPILL